MVTGTKSSCAAPAATKSATAVEPASERTGPSTRRSADVASVASDRKRGVESLRGVGV